MFRILLVNFCLLLLSLSTDSSAKVGQALEECKGCHTSDRLTVSERFSNGFGKWQDPQCFGCHQEITEIAVKFNSGIKDKRYFTLPVSDAKLKMIGHHALSYLHSPINPVKNIQKTGRFELSTLQRFLQRPFGKCDSHEICTAPKMMAYPKMKAADLSKLKQWFSTSNVKVTHDAQPTPTDRLAITSGRLIFNEKCSGCHSNSDISGYNSVGLSLFASQWIFNYANKLSKSVIVDRKMPKVPISKIESSQLAAFFKDQRSEKEQQLDNSLNDIPTMFSQDDTKKLSKHESFYLWKRLWRDNNCVHCHEIEGRAKNAFNTSETGITLWLKSNDPFDLYARLITRKKESQFAIGAKVPGMPMTKEPVPSQVTSLISRWIKNGCINLKEEALCKQKNKDNEILK